MHAQIIPDFVASTLRAWNSFIEWILMPPNPFGVWLDFNLFDLQESESYDFNLEEVHANN